MKKKLLYYTYRLIGDVLYLKLRYKQRTGKTLSLEHPETFTEKLQYLKHHDRRPIYTKCVDKIGVKTRVRSILGSPFVIPTLKVLQSPKELHAENLPDAPVIIKANHDSGGTRFIRDKSKVDFKDLQRHFDRKMKVNFFYSNMEWEYKNIKPRILIEPLMSDGTGNSLLNDYKIHCFHGVPQFIQMISDRAEGAKETWYNTEWKFLDMWYFASEHKIVERPKKLNEMLEIAQKLSKPFPYVRIDLYDTPDGILFGEYTFRPWGGYMKWNDEKWDKKLGDLIDLSLIKKDD
ncbi:ATP-grasp fold amidoligase family protein [Psychroflexus aestuariivivens]|uniref:ATP-grasp fold amidoligase family protein n=1 Tax=Psychroflexus aestuariivivens TaxID=1795040 RepID=UPI000FD97C21|nr:ATP-grasp fold amidoligase family protein [Psychroflexus aestuariivivens]